MNSTYLRTFVHHVDDLHAGRAGGRAGSGFLDFLDGSPVLAAALAVQNCLSALGRRILHSRKIAKIAGGILD